MITNCGLITERWYDITCPNIKPSITGSHIPYFHSMLCQWAYSISSPFFWVIVIEAQNRSHLLKSIQSVGSIEPTLKGKWEISQNALNSVFNDQTQNVIGCIFADSIRIPNESLNIGVAGGAQGTNGHLSTPIATGRGSNNNIQIGFRETNLSFADIFLKPWSIITSYKGLINDDGRISSNSGAAYWGGSIKSNIHIYQLATNGGVGDACIESVIRKEYHFYDAVPTNINSDDLKSEAGSPNMRQVDFTFNYYTIGTPK